MKFHYVFALLIDDKTPELFSTMEGASKTARHYMNNMFETTFGDAPIINNNVEVLRYGGFVDYYGTIFEIRRWRVKE